MVAAKMSFRWREETTLKFVSKFIEHECLWNIKSTHYKNKQMKESAYLDIEKSMNVPGFGIKEIKLKIKNIRSTYSQELKKIKESKNSGTGTDTVYIPTVKWFSLLDASLRNITSTLTQSESNLGSTSSHTDDTDTEQNSAVVGTLNETKLAPPKRKKFAQLSSTVSKLKEITDATNSSVNENEFEVFGKLVGVQLKSLPVLLALEAQEHIQLYLNNIRRQHLSDASEQNQNPGTPQSSHATESSLSNYSDYYYDEPSNYVLEEKIIGCNSSFILPTHPEHAVDSQPSSNKETQSKVRIISDNLILAAMHNANVNNESNA